MKKPPKTLVIAEAGVNHNGNLQVAKKLVDAACDAGADVVKFQTFQSSRLATDFADQANVLKSALARWQVLLFRGQDLSDGALLRLQPVGQSRQARRHERGGTRAGT